MLKRHNHIQISRKYKCHGISETSSGALGGSGGKEMGFKTSRNKERLNVKKRKDQDRHSCLGVHYAGAVIWKEEEKVSRQN